MAQPHQNAGIPCQELFIYTLNNLVVLRLKIYSNKPNVGLYCVAQLRPGMLHSRLQRKFQEVDSQQILLFSGESDSAIEVIDHGLQYFSPFFVQTA